MSSSSRAEVARSVSAGLRARLVRERALLTLFERGTRRGFGLWTAKLYAFGVCVTYALGISFARGSDRHGVIQGFVHAALVSLSWVVGALAALGTARISAQQAEREALTALARQRGFNTGALVRARALASALRIARLVGIPALLLVAVAVVRGQSLGWACLTAPAVALYAAALGLSLAALAQSAAELSSRHARALLAAFVLGPWLVSQAYPSIPSVPGVLSVLLNRLLDIGAALT